MPHPRRLHTVPVAPRSKPRPGGAYHRPLVVILLLTLIAAACGGFDPGPMTCGEIPLGGCPIGRGGTCEDELCAALYDCIDGKWTQQVQCPGEVTDGGASDAGTDAACEMLVLDHSGEVAGCTPDLQNPDCPAVAAETCVASACLTDCIDFYLCTADGWKSVAYCDADGQITLEP